MRNKEPAKTVCRGGRAVGLAAAALVSAVVLGSYGAAFHGDIHRFFRIGALLPHSPYLTVEKEALADGELGYDGQLFLAIALDPLLLNPRSVAALDNPRYRYRRIAFPLLGYALALGQRAVVPYALVIVNAFAFIGLVVVVSRLFTARNESPLPALLVLAVPGFWVSLLLTTADLLAALLLVLALSACIRKKYWEVAGWYALAALTHETLLVVIGSLAIPLLLNKRIKQAAILSLGAIPCLLWNLFVLIRIPAAGSTSGVFENFALPGKGIADKFFAVCQAPLGLKGLFDASAFAFLCLSFCLLMACAWRERRRAIVLPCALVYLGFFLFAKMQILSYYLDFLRVFAPALLLLVVGLAMDSKQRLIKPVLLVWSVVSLAFVGAYSLGFI
ncbi:MAG: hypothetical protein HY343_01095 [Lentisphaerae bacterium]|nr:hypothetical protein [Lentisphaerota bacterium]